MLTFQSKLIGKSGWGNLGEYFTFSLTHFRRTISPLKAFLKKWVFKKSIIIALQDIKLDFWPKNINANTYIYIKVCENLFSWEKMENTKLLCKPSLVFSVISVLKNRTSSQCNDTNWNHMFRMPLKLHYNPSCISHSPLPNTYLCHISITCSIVKKTNTRWYIINSSMSLHMLLNFLSVFPP